MSESKHTPTPWGIIDNPKSDFIDITINGAEGYGEIARIDRTSSFALQNARLIVRAVNCHDELLEALQLLENVLHPGVIGLIANRHGEVRMQEAVAILETARAAIAKATGK